MINDREFDALLRSVIADEAVSAEAGAPSLDHAVSTLLPRVQGRERGRSPLLLALATALLLVALLASAIAVGAWLRITSDERRSQHYAEEFHLVGQLPAEADPQAILALPDGSALLIGGERLYRFDAETLQFASVGSLQLPFRTKPASVLLQDGRVLIVGGGPFEPGGYPAEIYDPGSGTSTLTGSTALDCGSCTATPLDDGRVLIVGGSEPELFDPTRGEFTEIGACPPCQNLNAVLLDDGRTLIIGGYASGEPTASAVLYDPSTGTFDSAGPMAVAQVDGFTATRLNDGRIFIAGGWDDTGNVTGAAQIYDPTTDRFTRTDTLPAPRIQHSATRLRDGRVLIVGGWNGNTNAMADGDDAYIYDPSTGAFSPTASLTVQRIFPFVVTLTDGRVLVVGNRCFAGAGNCGLNEVGIGADRDFSAEVFE